MINVMLTVVAVVMLVTTAMLMMTAI